MVRAFAIAPTASCSYRSVDAEGFTCTPEIAPPIARTVDRDSGTFGVQTYDYGDVEIASEVGWENYKRVADGIMRLYQNSGLLHGYSYNWWSDLAIMDEAFIEEWLRSPQTSLYYSLQVMGDVQDKSNAYAALSEQEVDDYLADLFNGETNDLTNVTVKNEPLSKTNGAEAQMDTSETCCWYLQGRRGGDNPPCSCIATHGTTCGRFYY